MKAYSIFFVGSYRDGGEEAFRSAAGNLATAFAPYARQFILCSTSDRTVDRHVMDALKGAAPRVRIRLIHPRPEEYDGPPPDMSELRQDILPVEIESIEVNGGWRASHLRALQEADVVVVIGGSERGTGTVVYSADILGKPLILVPTFGGAAKSAWRDFARHYTDTEKDQLRGNPQSAHWSDEVVTASLAIIDRNPFDKSGNGRLLYLLIATVAALVGWGFIQWDLSRPNPLVTDAADLIAGLFFASVIGLALGERGKSVIYEQGEAYRLLASAIAIGFTTALFTDLLSFLVLGHSTLFELSRDEARGLLIRESLVAVLAGSVADRYFALLRRRAINVLS
jgi:hypothetical protein